MPSATVFCGKCKVPLRGKDQFLGHHMLSHELAREEAETAWSSAGPGRTAYWRD